MQAVGEARPFVTELSHTADVGFEVIAPDLPCLFERAALAFLDVVAELDDVAVRARRPVRAAGDGPVELLHAFLSALLLQVQLERFLGCAVAVLALDDHAVAAEVGGEPLDPARHRLHDEVKAITWHELGIERRDGAYRARVIVDV